MATKFFPSEHYMIIHYRELEAVWRMFADPNKIHQVAEAVQTVRTLNNTAGPDKALMTLVAASAWLTESEPEHPLNRDGGGDGYPGGCTPLTNV